MPSRSSYIRREEIHRLLQSHRKTAVAVESFLVLVKLLGIFLWVSIVGNATIWQNAVLCVVLLWLDLLLISPLKAGKARFYYRIAKGDDTVSFSLLFYYFNHRYRKCISWRLSIWLKRYGYWLLAFLPCSALLFWYRYLQNNPALSSAALFLGIVLGVLALLLVEIRLLRYMPAIYWLSCPLSLKRTLSVSVTLSAHRLNHLVGFYASYGWWVLFLPFIVPYFYISPLFQTARAATVDKMILEFLKQPLQHWKNHGKILSELLIILEEP
ncbi:MAG: hypothetical protein J6Q42_02415 [Clostridia bacterium]|jgi:hypothetical protein|nr:hypothetical protein [Clostridia bacterium]